MARIALAPTIASASGKVGGLVFSRNRYGAYLRQLAIPVNPNSEAQATARATFRSLSNRFSSVLTDAQRAAWAVYAANVKVSTTKGNFENITANAMYVRCNAPRVLADYSIVDDAPTTMLLAEPAKIGTVGIVASTHTLSVAFTNTEAWCTPADQGLLVYICKPVGATRIFIGSPFRYTGNQEGNAVPPTSPFTTANLPFPVAAGQKIRVKFRVSLLDGRLSDFFGETDVIAS